MLHPTNAFRDMDAIRQKVAGKRPVVFLDYDDAMRNALRDLSSKFVTAIATGRSIEKVYSFVQLDNLVYAGSHGFDIKGTKTRPINCQAADHFRPELEQALHALTEQTSHIAGAELEDNGLAISIRYRHIGKGITINVRDPEAMKAYLPGNLKELAVTKASYSLRDPSEVQLILTELARLECLC